MISLIEPESALLMADVYPLRPSAALRRRARARPSARVVTDLVIVAYGGALGLLGALVHPSILEVDAEGEMERGPDLMIGGFVAAVFVLLCVLISNIDLRALQAFSRTLRKLLACFTGALVIFVLLAWSSRTAWSEAQDPVLLWLVLGSSVLTVLHALVSRGLRQSSAIRHLTARRVAIVCGHQRTCARFLDLLRAQQDADIHLIGVFQDVADRRSSSSVRAGRGLEDLLECAREGRIDEIFLALPWQAERRISMLVDRLAHLPVDLKLCPDRVGYAHPMVIGESLAGVPVATLHRQPIRDWGRLVKRALDIGGSAVMLFLLAPLLAGLLDEVAGARQAAEHGELAFGTIDSFLLWRLTGGQVHATDASNAARTMLYDIYRQDWDDELLRLLRIPRAVLPEVRDCSAQFGATPAGLFGARVPITGIAGDQQAATVGQACFEPGMLKSTYGTGCFALLNTGATPMASRHRLLTTIAYRLAGKTTYALEGSIFVAGAAVQWLRDGLKLISHAGESEPLAAGIHDTGGVYLVPAFVGLGAPHWDPDARAAILGLTRDSGIAHIVRAALESVGYQTRDLMAAMQADLGGEAGADTTPMDGGRSALRVNGSPSALRVDGGMVANDWLCQFLADILDLPVERPVVTETTALGAACLAGLEVGLYPSLEAVANGWRCARRFEPKMTPSERARLYGGWLGAVRRVRAAY